MDGPVFEWDEAKRQANVFKHGLDFAQIEHFDFARAIFLVDDRRSYGEVRFRAFGRLAGVLCVAVLTRRRDIYRLISLRRANARERKRYGV